MAGTSEDTKLTGGDLAARTLKAAGVRQIFALHGGHHEALFKGCAEQGIALLDFRHESSAGHAADAWARTTGQLGVCIVTAGPGFTNAVSAIANAHLDGSPLLVLIGAPPVRELETNPMQGGIDQIAMCRPMTKWAVSIPLTERIPDILALAIRRATTGRPGPVVVELPIDVLHQSVLQSRATLPTGIRLAPRPAPAPEEIQAMVGMIRTAKRPVIIAGMDAISQQTSDALTRLADTLAIPVFHKTQAMGLIASGHMADGGAAGNLAMLPMLGIERPDLVIMLGARFGLLLGGRSGAIIPDTAQVAQIHRDSGELGRLRDVDLGIAADSSACLELLNSAIEANPITRFEDWCRLATSARSLFGQAFSERESANGIHPYHAAAAVSEAMGRSAIYVMDGGESASWQGATLAVDKPGQVLSHGYLGCLGIGPGFAIGAQKAHPERRVVHVTGDGTMGFHIAELDTMVRHNIPIVSVVMNNQVWGMSIHGQQIMYGKNYNMISKLGGTEFANIASAFGCYAERVVQYDQIGPAISRALASGKPAVIEIMTDGDVVHPVTTSMLGTVPEGSGEVMIPYYENIPA